MTMPVAFRTVSPVENPCTRLLRPRPALPPGLRAGLCGATLFACAVGAAAVPLDVKVLDTQGQPLADAVVSVDVKGARATAVPGTMAEMGQRNRVFVPLVLAVQTGTAVSFPNFDTVRHHVYSFSSIKSFEIKLYAGVPHAPVVFDKPGTAVLGCNIHDRMAGYIHVVGTPYFAKSDASGHATIDIPAGDHTLRTWHWRMSDSLPSHDQALHVGAGAANAEVRLGVSSGS